MTTYPKKPNLVKCAVRKRPLKPGTMLITKKRFDALIQCADALTEFVDEPLTTGAITRAKRAVDNLDAVERVEEIL